MTPTQYNKTYHDHWPAPIRSLLDEPDISKRQSSYLALAQQGLPVDVPIMVWGWDPWTTMSMRVSYGYTWVPSALQQPIAVAPGLAVPGLAAYDPNNPPSGSLTVVDPSLPDDQISKLLPLSADLVQAAPAPAVPSQDVAVFPQGGPQPGMMIPSTMYGQQFSAGYATTQGGIKLKKVMVRLMFGWGHFWQMA